MLGKRKKQKTPIPGNGRIAKFIASLIVVLGVLGIFFTYYGLTLPLGGGDSGASMSNRFFWQNLGVACIVFQVIQAFNLSGLQGSVYWFSWLRLKNPALDERQKIVRQRVFERAYGYSILIAIITVIYVKDAVPAFVATHSTFGDPLTPALLWVMVTFMISLPSIFAAWQKDS